VRTVSALSAFAFADLTIMDAPPRPIGRRVEAEIAEGHMCPVYSANSHWARSHKTAGFIAGLPDYGTEKGVDGRTRTCDLPITSG
jgi:hypothetical protein